jgi:large subunit ribosomal protein L27
MATSKSGGSTQNNRDSHSKRLGVKLFDGQHVSGGEIIVRQRGTHIHPGVGVGRGSDDTLFVKAAGILKFHYGHKGRSYVSVVPVPQI